MSDRKPGLIRSLSATTSGAGRATAELKAVVREVLDLDDSHTVMIQQLACTEPGCPPVETVVAVLSPACPPRRWTLHMPLSDVTSDKIRTTLINGDH